MDLNFEQLVQRYQAKQKEQEDLAFKAKYVVILIFNINFTVVIQPFNRVGGIFIITVYSFWLAGPYLEP